MSSSTSSPISSTETSDCSRCLLHVVRYRVVALFDLFGESTPMEVEATPVTAIPPASFRLAFRTKIYSDTSNARLPVRYQFR